MKTITTVKEFNDELNMIKLSMDIRENLLSCCNDLQCAAATLVLLRAKVNTATLEFEPVLGDLSKKVIDLTQEIFEYQNKLSIEYDVEKFANP